MIVSLSDVVAAPLDIARARLLRWLGRPARSLLADRAKRIDAYVVIGLVIAFAVAIVAPLSAFALGPVLFGVPHLVADVRYLVVRPGLHRQGWISLAAGAVLVLATISGSTALGLATGFLAIASIRLMPFRRGVFVLAWTGVIAAACRWPHAATLVLVHGHNALAIALFAFVFARTRRAGWLLGAGTIVFGAAILSGIFDGSFASSAPALRELSRTLAPLTGMSPTLAVRLVVLFVFAQGVHYAVWLRLVPDEARERAGLRTFASTFRALRSELGAPLSIAAVIFLVVVGVRALGSLEAARTLYLRGASFHGHLEIACALRIAAMRLERSSETPSSG